MKYLYLIIRHFFPRKYWKLVNTIKLYETEKSKIPLKFVYIYEDQFMKTNLGMLKK